MWRLRHRSLDAFVVVLAAAEFAALALDTGRSRLLAAALAAAGALVLLGRRRAPLAVSIVAFVLMAGSLLATPGHPNAQFFGLMATFAVVAAINTTRDGAIAGLAGAALLGAATRVVAPGNWLGDFVLTLGFCAVMWVAGWLVSRHTRRADVMALRALAAEQEQLIAVRDERARIARELHDVISHGLSVVVLQTLAARSAHLDGDPADVERHLDAVEATARDALAEMRRMLGLLQADDLTDSGPDPSPGFRDLPDLVDRARAAGLHVAEFDIDSAIDVALSPGAGLAAYRIVQEALTNAAKHAPAASVTVRVRVDGELVVVEVADDGGPARGRAGDADICGAGHGLIGMRERVALYGGALEASPAEGGGFRVHATLVRDQSVVTARVVR